MYSLNMPISRIRTKVREEFEKHRYVNNIRAVDVLLQQNQAEFQVGADFPATADNHNANTDRRVVFT